MRWEPTQQDIENSNIGRWMNKLGLKDFNAFHKWSVENFADFWQKTCSELKIKFTQDYSKVVDLSEGIENPQWFVGAKMNIADSCFNASPGMTAIVYQEKAGGELKSLTYKELHEQSNKVANALVALGAEAGDSIAIDMPMTIESVISYLGIVKMGGAAVSIADSFAPKEISVRLQIANANLCITQDVVRRGAKLLPMYEKVVEAGCENIIVIPSDNNKLQVELRQQDVAWDKFLSVSNNPFFDSVACSPNDATNILFSSGTTGEPKAIPWTHTTPIKAAMDGFFHHDIQEGDVVAWPTNLGWMMGPWLIYASLINRATMALCYEPPLGESFGQFVQDAKVTMLGLVPSIVKAWRATDCMSKFDWSHIKLFSSTGECSNPDDYSFLMGLANNRPIIEYCGGTEIGGGYISGTIVQPAVPSTFSTPCLGLDLVLLDDNNQPTDEGEVYLIGPSIGLSTRLLNKDHHEVYFKNVPKFDGKILRRHGDRIKRLKNGYYRGQGRADDTMNLGGIKTSSAEIERVLNEVDGVSETAAIALPPEGGGPDQLIVYAVGESLNPDKLKADFQSVIKSQLNPLFKLSDVLIIDKLPRTASNKVMRRVLRDNYKK